MSHRTRALLTGAVLCLCTGCSGNPFAYLKDYKRTYRVEVTHGESSLSIGATLEPPARPSK